MNEFLFSQLFFGLTTLLSVYAQISHEFEDAVDAGKFERLMKQEKGVEFYPKQAQICLDSNNDTLYIVPNRISQLGGDCRRHSSADDRLIAIGRYRNAVNESGWGILEIETFDGIDHEFQAYAAGLLEGFLTAQQIGNHIENTVLGICKGYEEYCKRLDIFLADNYEWMRSEVLARPDTDRYWRQVNCTLTQLSGIYDGWKFHEATNSTTFFSPKLRFSFREMRELLLLQYAGDLYDLENVLNKTANFNTRSHSPGHCSALIALRKGNNDLFGAHVTFNGYNAMNRVLKLYKFAYDKKQVPGHTISFSGYAGTLQSTDDFTLTSAGLLSLETTIDIFNRSIYLRVSPIGQLPCWLRSYVSNQLASSGKEWTRIFSRFNSGTYNNQWSIVDYKKFRPGHQLPRHNLLWMLEQIPGKTVARDITWLLRRYGYWASYNLPYFDEIIDESGTRPKALENDWWSWESAPRARMFTRDVRKVHDLQSLMELMRYNDYKHDKFSQCKCQPPYTAQAAISSRGDLNPANGTYEVEEMGHRNFGSLDYKGTNFAHFQQLRFHAIGGPTYGGPSDIPPFSWETFDFAAFPVNHTGQPKTWKFEPFFIDWKSEVEVAV